MNSKGLFCFPKSHWPFLGFGFAYTYVASWTVALSGTGENRLSLLFWFFVGSLACTGLLFATWRAWSKALCERKPRAIWCGACIALAIGCTLSFAFGLSAATQTFPAHISIIVSTVLFGALYSLIWIPWAYRFSAIEPDTMLPLFVFGAMAACATATSLSLLSVPHMVIGSISGVLASVAFACSSQQAKYCDQRQILPTLSFGFHRVSYSTHMTRSIFVFLFVLAFSFSLSHGTMFGSFSNLTVALAAEDLVAIVLLVVILFSIKSVGIVTLCRVLVPLVCIAFLCQEIAPQNLRWLCMLVADVGQKVARPFMWIMLFRVLFSQEDRIRIRTVCGAIVCIQLAGALAALFSIIFHQRIGDTESLLLSTILLMLIVVVAFFILPSGHQYAESSRTVSSEKSTPAFSIEDACHMLAEQGELSQREFDVLILMASGLSQANIAQELILSNHTVHAHVSHIYAKLDIHSKQELISRVRQIVNDHS